MPLCQSTSQLLGIVISYCSQQKMCQNSAMTAPWFIPRGVEEPFAGGGLDQADLFQLKFMICWGPFWVGLCSILALLVGPHGPFFAWACSLLHEILGPTKWALKTCFAMSFFFYSSWALVVSRNKMNPRVLINIYDRFWVLIFMGFK